MPFLLYIAILVAVNDTGGSIVIKNGDFELDTDEDGMSDFWQFSGDSGVVACWSRDEGLIGKYSQRLTCTSFSRISPASHAMLCQLNTIKLEEGKWYKVSFYAKQQGINNRSVQIAIVDMRSWTDCGLQRSFRVPKDWKQFEFKFQATKTITENTRLQIWFNTTGTLWIDDVRFESSTPIKRVYTNTLPNLPVKNLIPNSSFECGTSGWGSITDVPGWGGNLNQLVGEIDHSIAKFHKSSLKISLNPDHLPVYYFDYFPLYRIPIKAPLLANRGWISVDPNEAYTLSAYMKADRDDLIGVLSVRQAFQRTLKQEFKLSTKWERYKLTFKPDSEQIFIATGLDLTASNQEEGTIWIDGVQLERGSAPTEYQPRHKIELGVRTNHMGNIFPYGVKPEIKIVLFNADETDHDVDIDWSITNFNDFIVRKENLSIKVASQTPLEIPVDTKIKDKGFYRFHVKINGNESETDRAMRFAVIDPYEGTDSLFGMNHAYPYQHLLDLSRDIGILWFRDWSLKWQDIEPERGRFNFKEADHQINRVLEKGINVLPLLPFPSSNWASSSEQDLTGRYPEIRERMSHMPKDLNDFRNYVKTTVNHYKERLHVWEILNEPIYTDYALPRSKGYKVEDYVRILRVAYEAVKEGDPTALVIGGIAGDAETYTREFIESGGLNWVDALNLHIYPGVTAPEEFERSLGQLRNKMREANMDKPIWFTEGAYYADDDIPIEPYVSWLTPLDNEMEASEWQVKFNVILLTYGVQKIIYHSGTTGSINNESLEGIFFEWGGTPRKMLVTQSAMANLLKPPVYPLGRIDSLSNVRAYGFVTSDRTVVCAWTEEGTIADISMKGTSWKAIDIQGNELSQNTIKLTERPIYFTLNEAIKELTSFPY